MANMTDQELSLRANKNRNFLAELKCRDAEKYKLIKKIGIPEFEEYATELRTRLGMMYWEIKDDPDMTFTELYHNYCPNSNSTIHSFMNYISKMSFQSRSTFPQLRAVKRMEVILEAFKQYKKDIKGVA